MNIASLVEQDVQVSSIEYTIRVGGVVTQPVVAGLKSKLTIKSKNQVGEFEIHDATEDRNIIVSDNLPLNGIHSAPFEPRMWSATGDFHENPVRITNIGQVPLFVTYDIIE